MTSFENQALYRVAFLLDKSNNWIEQPLRDSGILSIDPRYNMVVCHDWEQIDGYHIVFILCYTKILDTHFLSKNYLNLIVHESDLPFGRGFSPVQWQILEGRKIIDVCLIEAVEKVDAGDIILRNQIQLNGSELYGEIRVKQAQAIFSLLDSRTKCNTAC